MNKQTYILQIFGCLLNKPSILANTEKYTLTPADFDNSFTKKIFASIYNLYIQGLKKISIFDIDNYLKETPSSYEVFSKGNGIEFLQDALDYGDVENFDYYYKELKKINCIKDLQRKGFDISEFYCDNPLDTRYEEINKKFQDLTIQEILDEVKKKISNIENHFVNEKENETHLASEGMDKFLNSLKIAPDAGARLQGKLFNTAVRGARKGKYYLRSASSGTGKTRQAVGDACYLSYPMRYSQEQQKWEYAGGCEKSLIVVTEQEDAEVKSLILAYLTGINEEVLLYGTYTQEQEKIIRQAVLVMDKYPNVYITRMSNPSIAQLQVVVREQVILHGIENLFYDYIFSNPALLNEFRDLKIREDR